MIDPLVLIAVACWGIVGAVWLAGGVYNATRASRPRIRPRSRSSWLVRAAFAACAIVVVVGQVFAQDLVIDVLLVRLVGFALLLVATMFALWARFSLGTSWSVAPRIGGDRRLRTSGPYAVTRHPIYSGILGMAVGSALIGGLGEWLVIVAVLVIALEARIRMEEQLLLRTFPDEYARYRERVPQLVPGLLALRRSASRAGSAGPGGA